MELSGDGMMKEKRKKSMDKTYHEELGRILSIAQSLGFRARIHEVVKENCGTLKGVQVFPRKDSRGAAVIYPSAWTLRLSDLDLRDRILEAAARAEAYEKRMSDIETFDPEKLRIRVCGARQNCEMLSHCPHQERDGIAFVPYLDYGDAGVVANNSLVGIWGVEPETLMAEAWKQSAKHDPAVIRPVVDIIGEEHAEDDKGLLCVTNASAYHGGACLFYPGVMDKLFQRFQGSYFAIPSSVHEWLVYPADGGITAKDLADLLRSVNSTLEKSDILSDCLYYYDREGFAVLG